MTLFLLNYAPSNPLLSSSNLPRSLKPKPSKLNRSTSITATLPARDRVIDFGKHKGKMLGTLPSSYLKWVSNNLRARDFEHWAKLADQVLQDPLYKDRLEWEYADKLLNGDISSSRIDSPVQQLLEISERFGWDNEDKAGWSRVNFELLGTSKGGRIPRVLGGNNGGGERDKVRVSKGGEERGRKCNDGGRIGHLGKEGGGEVGGRERRGERRERLRRKRDTVEMGEEKLGIRGKDGGRFGNGVEGKVRFERNQENQDDRTVEIYNPFPGRETLLKKVLNRERAL
ncbi:hypothetical protein L1049_004735 [Liquidambar formosana]|uniref:Uncharacterized protein n=1 Tax=Liquidambar formosana TaxID=63359 RepID=A0AAP0WVZ1_LIQFO